MNGLRLVMSFMRRSCWKHGILSSNVLARAMKRPMFSTRQSLLCLWCSSSNRWVYTDCYFVRIKHIVNYLQSDPRFVNTLKQILKTPDRGGLTSNVKLFVIWSLKPNWGVAHRTLFIVTMSKNRTTEWEAKKERFVCARSGARGWQKLLLFLISYTRCIEALTRAGTYDKVLLQRAISMFEVSTYGIYDINETQQTTRTSCFIPTTLVYARRKSPRLVKGELVLNSFSFKSLICLKAWQCGSGFHVSRQVNICCKRHSLTTVFTQPRYSDFSSI
jgi:hypothetical protein